MIYLSGVGGSYEDHLDKVDKVLERLANADLKLDLKNCKFAVKEVKYLGFITTAEKDISVDPEKKAAIENWETPNTQTGIRRFLGFANFYRDFIDDFANLTAPLQRYTKKQFSGLGKIKLDGQALKSFDKLKRCFISAPVLALFDPDLKAVLETDCSGWAMGACLSQLDSQGRLRPVDYFSKKLSPPECNYNIHDKELLAIVRSVEFWRAELMSLLHPLEILTDHKNSQYFMSKKILSERQIRWKILLDDLPGFVLRYRPGKEATRPDALSRLEQDKPKDCDDPRLQQRVIKLIEDDWIAAADIPTRNQNGEIQDCIKTPFDDDNLIKLMESFVTLNRLLNEMIDVSHPVGEIVY